MNRRNFFASLFAPLAARFVPKAKAPDALEREAGLARLQQYYAAMAEHTKRTYDASTLWARQYFADVNSRPVRLPTAADMRRAMFLRPKVRSEAEKRWRAEYRQQRASRRVRNWFARGGALRPPVE